jgi:hypothetical protein
MTLCSPRPARKTAGDAERNPGSQRTRIVPDNETLSVADTHIQPCAFDAATTIGTSKDGEFSKINRSIVFDRMTKPQTGRARASAAPVKTCHKRSDPHATRHSLTCERRGP